jgi:chromosomal replication initiation ATPase DnaA
VPAAARHFGVTERDIYGRCRLAPINAARQTVLMILSELSGFSDGEIGHLMGRDRSLVSRARRVVRNRLETDPGFRRRFSAVRAELGLSETPEEVR